MNALPILNVVVILVGQLDGCALVYLALDLVLDRVSALLFVNLRRVLKDDWVVLLVGVQTQVVWVHVDGVHAFDILLILGIGQLLLYYHALSAGVLYSRE